MRPGDPISIPDKIVAVANTLPEKPPGEIREQLIFLINELIKKDFDGLVQLLYRIDVDERKLKQFLKANADTNAASIMADLIISRQLQKIATKKQFSERKKPGTDDSW